MSTMIKHLRKLISITLIIAIFTQTLPAYAASFDSTSDTVYASRATYFEENYWAYKYVDRYYSNSARVGTPIDTVTTECWP